MDLKVLNPYIKMVNKYKNIILYFILFILSSSLSLFIYKIYRNKNDVKALKDLLDNIISFNVTKDSKNLDENAFNAIYKAFDLGAEKYKNSNLYPYFLLYKAEILIEQNKKLEAIEYLSKAIYYINKNSIIYWTYSLKNALLKIDSKDDKYVQIGLNELKDLSQNNNNELKDMAKYYYGLSLYSLNKKDEAKAIWDTIPVIKGQSIFQDSIEDITKV